MSSNVSNKKEIFVENNQDDVNLCKLNMTSANIKIPVQVLTMTNLGEEDVSDKCKLSSKKYNNNIKSSHLNGTHNLNQVINTVHFPIVTTSNGSEENLKDSGEDILTAASSSPTFPNLSSFTNGLSKFKCDISSCNKEFATEQRLKKHKNVHNKTSSNRTPRQTSIECPVKKLDDGFDKPCGRVYSLREDLLKHLSEDHTIEDAPHRCEECGRRFFWITGLRAHGRAHCSRGPVLPCAWPGCGRVFHQPCRLREHTRVHTGDKPYPCRHPDCGWSFRTASKLVRHAARHTGERRHACTACGHAFLRREHLRLHHARYHQPNARLTHACTHHGCEHTFNNMSSLYLHMKRVHKKQNDVTTTVVDNTHMNESDVGRDVFVENLNEVVDESNNVAYYASVGLLDLREAVGAEESVITDEVVETDVVETDVVETNVVDICENPEVMDETGIEEWHSARTHCTWPLTSREETQYEYYDNCDDSVYILHEDVQVEQCESIESNVYTIRSDLFLHGNVLNSEDSQNMNPAEVDIDDQPVEQSGERSNERSSVPMDTDLGLLDSHSTIDLMQEALMYTGVAGVDESSFRVFLLTGEELT